MSTLPGIHAIGHLLQEKNLMQVRTGQGCIWTTSRNSVKTEKELGKNIPRVSFS